MDFIHSDNDATLERKLALISAEFNDDFKAVDEMIRQIKHATLKKKDQYACALNRFYVTLNKHLKDRIWLQNLMTLQQQRYKHEEVNRYYKMRFIRNMAQVYRDHRMDIFKSSLLDLATVLL